MTVTSTGDALACPDQTYAFYRLFGDVDGSGTVGMGDYNAMVDCFLAAPGSANYNPDLDYDGNGDGIGAYNAFLDNFFVTQTCLATTDLYYSDRGQVIEEQQNGAATTQ